jgi:glycosyltransferase involved in cell wall biosynthesis
VARGIQNKVLEAMAMAKPVVVSAAAASGINAVRGVDFETAGDAEEFCQKLLAVMRPEVGHAMGRHARARIVADYCWARNLSAFDKLLEPESCAAAGFAPRSVDAH